MRFPSSPTATWALLVTATSLSFAVFDLAKSDRRGAAIIVMGVAAVKVGLILRNFMELRLGPIGWKLFFAAWTFGCAALIAGVYCYAP